jgi:hypothetical protein
VTVTAISRNLWLGGQSSAGLAPQVTMGGVESMRIVSVRARSLLPARSVAKNVSVVTPSLDTEIVESAPG